MSFDNGIASGLSFVQNLLVSPTPAAAKGLSASDKDVHNWNIILLNK